MAKKTPNIKMKNLKISPACDSRLTRYVKKKCGRVYGNKAAEAERLINEGIKNESKEGRG